MKRIFSTTFVSLLAVATMSAQEVQNPKGLYRLQKFIYEDGSEKTPDFSQYKYAADSVGLLSAYSYSGSPQLWNHMTVEIREPHPLRNTGEKPQGADGHDIQIFNVKDGEFSFKWYNTQWENMSKLNEFITEVYGIGGMEDEVVKAYNMLENKFSANDNKFYGWWVRIAAAEHPDGTGQRYQVPVIWKAYSPEMSLIVHIEGNGGVLVCDMTKTVKYENDSTIYEIGHPCNMKWLNKDCHTLTFVQENGVPLTEIWVRCGLPRMWQDVFNTNVEIYRDANECLRLAIEEVKQDNLKRADEYFTEAIYEKNVEIGALSNVAANTAIYLYYNKQDYKNCQEFCTRYLQQIEDYTKQGHDHVIDSKIYCHEMEILKAICTYRNGDTEKGRRMMDKYISVINSEIERYRNINGMEAYINGMYFCNFFMYDMGYDIFGAEQTLPNVDALALMAPFLTFEQNKSMLLRCRGNCYLLLGDKENARKLWQQIKEKDKDFFKREPAVSPLKKEFGE